MTTQILCPHCKQQLTIPEGAAGKKLKCPTCKQVFTSPAGSRPVPNPVEQPAEPPNHAHEDKEAHITASSPPVRDQEELPSVVPVTPAKPTLRRQDYPVPWYVYAPALLPLGIPIAMFGGWVWVIVGIGVSGVCFAVARTEVIPPGLRICASLAISGVTYVLIGLCWLIQAPSSGQESSPTNVADSGAAPSRDLSPLEKAQAKAKVEGKVVMLEFGWGGGDDEGAEDKRYHPQVRDWIRKNTVLVRASQLGEENLARDFEAQDFMTPVTAFLNPDGAEIGRIVGAKEPEQFLQEATDVVEGKKAPFQPDPGMLGPGNKVYLSDMRERQARSEHAQRLEQYFGKSGFIVRPGNERRPILVNGKKTEHGLSMTPIGPIPARVFYALGKKAQVFRAIAAIDDRYGVNPEPVEFRVLGDRKELWKSSNIHGPFELEECIVDVSGVNELELRVEKADGVWFEPRLYKDGDEARREPALVFDRGNIRITEGEVPQSIAVNEKLAGPRTQSDFISCAPLLNRDAPNLFPCLCWSADGKSFYYLNAPEGKLGQVTLDDLCETRRLEIGRFCSWLSVSAEGLLVSIPQTHEVWVIDEKDLQVKSRLRVAGAHRVVSAPTLSVAFSEQSGGMAVIDLKAGKLVFGPEPGYPAGYKPQLEGAQVTADGKYLFTHSKGNPDTFGEHHYLDKDWQFQCLRIEGSRLIYAGTSPPLGSGEGVHLYLSPDSKYVCFPVSGQTPRKRPTQPPPDGGDTPVYAVNDLTKPAFALKRDPGSRDLLFAFDPPGEYIYGCTVDNDKASLRLFGPSGQSIRNAPLPDKLLYVRQILPHPAGGKMLLLGDQLLFVEIGKPAP